MLGQWDAAHREHGPLISINEAAYVLGVDKRRVRRMIEKGQLVPVGLPAGDPVVQLVPLRALYAAPTELERGRPLVLNRAGEVVRDEGGHNGECQPLTVGRLCSAPNPRNGEKIAVTADRAKSVQAGTRTGLAR